MMMTIYYTAAIYGPWLQHLEQPNSFPVVVPIIKHKNNNCVRYTLQLATGLCVD